MLEDEDKFIGEEVHLVPKLDPDDNCNARKTEDTQGEETGSNKGRGTRTIFKGYCKNKAGKGTEHVGEGRCKFHGGSTVDSPDHGAPKHNQNGAKSQVDADPHHYAQSLPQDEKEFVEDTSHAILDRIRRQHGREPDFIDRIISRRIAIRLHMVAAASDYTRDELVQVIQHEHGSHEEPGALVQEIRRFDNSIISDLKDIGVLDDPQSQKADEMSKWREFIQSGSQQQKDEVVVEVDEESSDD